MGQGLVGKGDRFFLADNQLTNCDAYPVAAPQHSCCFEYGMQIDLFLRKSHYDSDCVSKICVTLQHTFIHSAGELYSAREPHSAGGPKAPCPSPREGQGLPCLEAHHRGRGRPGAPL